MKPRDFRHGAFSWSAQDTALQKPINQFHLTVFVLQLATEFRENEISNTLLAARILNV